MSTIDLTPLHRLPARAAGYITEKGWTREVERNAETGSVCITGAFRYCSPVPGDGSIAREVFRRRGRAESWNDSEERTADEVISYLASTEITDTELESVFGPQWLEIVALVRKIAGATGEQIKSLSDARSASRDAAWAATRRATLFAARYDTLFATRGAAGDAARGNAWGAARGNALGATWFAAWAAARAASWGLVTRDLIGTQGYTQQHYDLLSAPLVSVFGPLHAGDVIA